MSKRQKAAKFGESAPTIHRPRLVQDLEEQLKSRRLILVIAPPGYGKSSMLADFTETSDTPVCTIQLTEAARDPAILAERATSALVKRFRRLRGAWDEPGSTDEPVSPQAIGKALAGQVPERHAIFIDGIEALQGATEAVAYLDQLLENLPEQTTLMLAGRRLPALSLAELVAADLVKSYSAVELTLDFDEMVELVELRTGEAIDQARADQLYQRTEGWVTGMLLSEEVQPAFVTAGMGRSLVDEYFHAAAFEGESDKLTRFLLESSLLPVFNADLCDHVLGRDDSQAMIDQLLRSGCYLFHEGYYPERFFRYQRQYQRFLKGRADISAERVEQILGRAVEWYEQHQLPEFAFDLAIEQGDYEAAKAIADEWASPMYVQKRTELLNNWHQELKESLHPSAELIRALALVAKYVHADSEESLSLLDKARGLAASNDEAQTLFRVDATKLALSYTHQGDLDRESLLAKLKESLSDVPEEELGRYYSLEMQHKLWDQKKPAASLRLLEKAQGVAEPADLVQCLIIGSVANAELGKLLEAYDVLRKAEMISLEGHHLSNLGFIYVNLATISHYLGMYFEAFFRYSISIDSFHRGNSKNFSILGLIGLGELFIDFGYFKLADRYLKQALISIEDPAYSDISLIQLFYAKSLRKQGRLDEARERLSKIEELEDDWYYEYAKQIENILLEYSNEPAMAITKLSKAKREARHNLVGLLSIDIEILKLLAKLGREDEAAEVMEQLMGFVSDNNLHHYLVIEAFQDKSLRNLLIRSRQDRTGELVSKINDFIRTRERFKFVIPDLADGLIFQSLGRINIGTEKDRKVNLRPIHQELLFFLLEWEQVSRDECIETFWPNLPEDKQSANLHSAIYQIRRSLGSDIVKLASGMYSVSSKALEAYDASAFRKAVSVLKEHPGAARFTLGRYQEALSLYGGGYLPGMYSDWVIERRRELHAIYISMLLDYSRTAVTQESGDLAKGRLRDAVVADPLNEELVEAYLDLLFHTNNYQELITLYRQFEARMAEELQLRPKRNILEIVQRAYSDSGRGVEGVSPII